MEEGKNPFLFLNELAALPKEFALLLMKMDSVQKAVQGMQKTRADNDRWLDAKGAAKYVGMSMNTFDKHRFKSQVKPNGYKVGGKWLYKREDLDSWVKLWDVNQAMRSPVLSNSLAA